MDIASRLRQFMAEKNIASSQFADSADIPRPTLSQLLNGRNKKISNELIAKIHEAFPSLNVLWLMFGEGEMEQNANMQFSQPQNQPISASGQVQEPRYETVLIAQAPDYDARQSRARQTTEAQPRQFVQQNVSRGASERQISPEEMKALSSAGLRVGDAARVQQIMVLYTDGRFETFRPASE